MGMGFPVMYLNASLSGSVCPSDLPCLAADGNDLYCFKYACRAIGVCSTDGCFCNRDSDCAGSLSGTSSTPYCLSGRCSTLSSGGLAGIIIAALAVAVAIAYYVCVVRRRRK